MTTEMPILFNGTMVRAILSGAKTITRRPVVPMAGRQRQWLTPAMLTQSPRLTMCRLSDADGGDLGAQMEHPKGGPLGWVRCPLGAPGDRLWVRENAYIAPPNFGDRDLDTCRDAEGRGRMAGYAASMDSESVETAHSYGVKCTPSIHMPRWASRLSLDVVSVGVERLQDITEDDARREGIEPVNGGWGLAGESWSCGSARGAFQTLWDLIGGDGAWRENPWVWRVEFTRAEGGR